MAAGFTLTNTEMYFRGVMVGGKATHTRMVQGNRSVPVT